MNFLSIESGAVGCWKFESSFFFWKANAMRSGRSDWYNGKHDAGEFVFLTDLCPTGYFVKVVKIACR